MGLWERIKIWFECGFDDCCDKHHEHKHHHHHHHHHYNDFDDEVVNLWMAEWDDMTVTGTSKEQVKERIEALKNLHDED